MNALDFTKNMYKAVDAKDAAAIAEMMTEDGSFKFANQEAVVGRSNIQTFLEGFFNSIKSISHSNLEAWFIDANYFITGTVTYNRMNDTHLQVPFSVNLKMEGNLIKNYNIYVDASTLYQ